MSGSDDFTLTALLMAYAKGRHAHGEEFTQDDANRAIREAVSIALKSTTERLAPGGAS